MYNDRIFFLIRDMPDTDAAIRNQVKDKTTELYLYIWGRLYKKVIKVNYD